MAMSGCVAGAGDRSSLPQWCGRTSTTVSPTGRPRASISIRLSGEAIVGTEDHGIPGADFSVVLADSVAEDDTKSIVVRSRWQPTNQPFASLGPRSSGSISAGSCSRRSHSAGSIRTRCMGTARVAAAGLMRREQYIRAEQRGCAHSMMLLSQQMRIVIGGHRSNKSDRLASGRRLALFRDAAIKTLADLESLAAPDDQTCVRCSASSANVGQGTRHATPDARGPPRRRQSLLQQRAI